MSSLPSRTFQRDEGYEVEVGRTLQWEEAEEMPVGLAFAGGGAAWGSLDHFPVESLLPSAIHSRMVPIYLYLL